MNIDDLGLSIGSKLFDHSELLQPQIEQFYNINQRYSDIFGTRGVWADMMENWSSASGLSNLGISSNYSQLVSEMQKISTPEVMGIASAVNEFADLTASLRESISYSGLSKVIESFHSSILENMDYASLSNTVAGLNRIFNDELRDRLSETVNSLSNCAGENPSIMEELFNTISEEEYEGYSIDDHGSLICNGNVVALDEIRQMILDSLTKCIDWIKNSKIKFETKHKIACFVIGVYLEICFLMNVPPAQPVISAGQKVISMANNYENKYFVSEENVRVYSTPTSKSKVVYRLSYGKTVISESNINGWIKVSISAGDKVYQGWVAKRNLISYDKAKFHSDELEHEVE